MDKCSSLILFSYISGRLIKTKLLSSLYNKYSFIIVNGIAFIVVCTTSIS
jgi:hypothetical protein